MSDLLGPLLGMSPYLGYSSNAGVAAQAVNYAALVQYGRCPYCGGPGLLNGPAPEPPGITWTPTGGKSWRVRIVRQTESVLIALQGAA